MVNFNKKKVKEKAATVFNPDESRSIKYLPFHGDTRIVFQFYLINANSHYCLLPSFSPFKSYKFNIHDSLVIPRCWGVERHSV